MGGLGIVQSHGVLPHCPADVWYMGQDAPVDARLLEGN